MLFIFTSGSMASTARRSQQQFVRLSLRWFILWWIIILSVHCVACGYNAIYAVFYWNFGDTFLSYTLEVSQIGLPREYFFTVSYVYIALALLHGLCALFMISGSLMHRTLQFSAWISKQSSTRIIPDTNPNERKNTTRCGCCAGIVSGFLWLYQKFAGRQGLLGVNGKHFHIVFVGRELLQTSLQTIQAIRMSKYLPRLLLNRFYVSLVAINCWSCLLIESRWFWENEAHRRFAVILCDVVLNLVSTLGMPLIIVLSYLDMYRAEILEFDYSILGDEVWAAQLLNEAQIVVVISWSDLLSRIVFSLGLVASTSDMKDLLRNGPSNGNKVANQASAVGNMSCVVPTGSDPAKEVKTNDVSNGIQLLRQTSNYKAAEPQVSHRRKVFKMIYAANAAWGVVLIILHAHASIKEPLYECATQVRPMANLPPSCYVVNFDCRALGISGRFEEIQREWGKFDKMTSWTLRFLHCPALEVPPSFLEFHVLQQIEVYNSTIVDWGAGSAITSTNHPELAMLSVVRVNMTDGLLPLGFQSPEFPSGLGQINFCETNLRAFPDDIDSKWPSGSGIYIENNQLTEIPASIARLEPVYLMARGNPIDQLPPELFEARLSYLTLGGTNLAELPQNVDEPSTALAYLDVTDTDIAFFWSWMEPLVEDMFGVAPLLAAGGTPFCSDLDSIMSGSSYEFSAPFQADQSPLLMNASMENWEYLLQAVDCSPSFGLTLFPLESWDARFSITDSAVN